ncbi:unnamed protein product [marine sediment metagenome]|uniref:Capsule synthesis protein CapA domain-containing protein n=1 Tax=marine sediment metagenome TaxID=412755 RepID=X1AKU9_9ZZZZ
MNLHWGYEYVHYPHPGQIKLAHNLIDAGADLIFGHHPHVIQGYEEYDGKYIFYSLGNFQFGIRDNKYTNVDIGMAVKFCLDGSKPIIFPVQINKSNCPILLGSHEKEAVLNKLHLYSLRIKTGLYYSLFWYIAASKNFLISNYKSWFYRIQKNWYYIIKRYYGRIS